MGLQEAVTEITFMALVFFLGLLLARLLVPATGYLARKVGAIDRPNARKVHQGAIPRLGGLAMAAALVLTLLACVRLDQTIMPAFLIGAGIVFVTGLLDDTLGLTPKQKFIGEILAALAFVGISGFYLDSLGDLLGLGEIRLGWLAPAFTIFCMVGVMNALNLSDGLDGLAGGISFIAALFLAALAYEHQATYWALISVALLGVLLGFLRHNHFPASLFMGDGGSLLLGYSLVAITVGLVQGGNGVTPISPVTPGIILALPIIDTLWVMGKRLGQGKNPFHPDQTHLHHRLKKLGLGHAGVVVVLYVVMISMGFLAWQGRNWPEWWQLYAVLLFFALFYGTLGIVEKREVDLGERLDRLRLFRQRWRRITPGDRLDRGLRAAGPALALLLPAPAFIQAPLPGFLGLLALAGALLILLLYPWRGARRRLLLGHGIFYLAIFCLLLLYILPPDRPGWLLPWLYGCSSLAFVWVLVRTATSRRQLLLYPSGLEILLLFVSWSIPLVLLPMLGVGGEVREGVFIASVLVLPLHCLLKLNLRRVPSRNLVGALLLLALLIELGLTSLG